MSFGSSIVRDGRTGAQDESARPGAQPPTRRQQPASPPVHFPPIPVRLPDGRRAEEPQAAPRGDRRLPRGDRGRSLAGPSEDSGSWATFAAIAAAIADLLGEEREGGANEEKVGRNRSADLAMEYLTRSADAGILTNPRFLSQRPIFKGLRDREDFRALHDRLEKAKTLAAANSRAGGSTPATKAAPVATARNLRRRFRVPPKSPCTSAATRPPAITPRAFWRSSSADGTRRGRRSIWPGPRARGPRPRRAGNLRNTYDLGMTHFALGDLANAGGKYALALREWGAGRESLQSLPEQSPPRNSPWPPRPARSSCGWATRSAAAASATRSVPSWPGPSIPRPYRTAGCYCSMANSAS